MDRVDIVFDDAGGVRCHAIDAALFMRLSDFTATCSTSAHIPARFVTTIASRLVKVLSQLHAGKRIHGNVSPDHIILTHYGGASLLHPCVDEAHPRPTAYNTPYAEPLEPRHDMGALGCSLYYLVSGGSPAFVGDSEAALRRHMAGGIPLFPSGVPLPVIQCITTLISVGLGVQPYAATQAIESIQMQVAGSGGGVTPPRALAATMSAGGGGGGSPWKTFAQPHPPAAMALHRHPSGRMVAPGGYAGVGDEGVGDATPGTSSALLVGTRRYSGTALTDDDGGVPLDEVMAALDAEHGLEAAVAALAVSTPGVRNVAGSGGGGVGSAPGLQRGLSGAGVVGAAASHDGGPGALHFTPMKNRHVASDAPLYEVAEVAVSGGRALGGSDVSAAAAPGAGMSDYEMQLEAARKEAFAARVALRNKHAQHVHPLQASMPPPPPPTAVAAGQYQPGETALAPTSLWSTSASALGGGGGGGGGPRASTASAMTAAHSAAADASSSYEAALEAARKEAFAARQALRARQVGATMESGGSGGGSMATPPPPASGGGGMPSTSAGGGRRSALPRTPPSNSRGVASCEPATAVVAAAAYHAAAAPGVSMRTAPAVAAPHRQSYGSGVSVGGGSVPGDDEYEEEGGGAYLSGGSSSMRITSSRRISSAGSAAQADYEASLEAARKQAFAERLQLQARYGRG